MQISDFYMKAPLYEPPDFVNREFGFKTNGEKMVRHKAFSSIQKLRTYLIETAPDHVYFSSSKYETRQHTPWKIRKRVGAGLTWCLT
jgi:DNA primase small subunit